MNRLTFAIFNFIDAINFFEEHILCQNIIYENYAEEKKETKFTTYQHTESVIERVLFRDRTHPVDSVIINDFNQKTGADLEEVKMIYGAGADEYTRSRHALAIVLGDKIYFRNGAYKPETEEGIFSFSPSNTISLTIGISEMNSFIHSGNCSNFRISSTFLTGTEEEFIVAYRMQ